MSINTKINAFRRLIFVNAYDLDLDSMPLHAANSTEIVVISDSEALLLSLECDDPSLFY